MNFGRQKRCLQTPFGFGNLARKPFTETLHDAESLTNLDDLGDDLGVVDLQEDEGAVLDGLEGLEVDGRGRFGRHGKLVGDRGFRLVAWFYTPEI